MKKNELVIHPRDTTQIGQVIEVVSDEIVNVEWPDSASLWQEKVSELLPYEDGRS